jgi:shikimate dehydrogenase
VNVTLPHKLAALALADEASAAAQAIGAANTLSFTEGRIHAENTDAAGAITALPRSPAGAKALVLGAGGSARAVAWALRDAGAEVTVWNRTTERGVALAQELGVGHASTPQPGFDLLVNATTVGMTGASESASGGQPSGGPGTPDLKALGLSADWLDAEQVVMDLVYGTKETELIAAARTAGASTVDGLEFLVCQGIESLRIWTGREASVETMRRAARGTGASL